ncbi:hypothetical protein [Pedobacter cryoconitis]|uniref:Uncharacterized protein n=1 Tax=Pedobacter cryoconitis TaxID=188932 RepID=A0A7X0J411_9SPHI|nr:hypothetical protein [Pedobacter cryoconitis]MBB6499256.1 hypothetical protein [Pedobacter cryoconitis]
MSFLSLRHMIKYSRYTLLLLLFVSADFPVQAQFKGLLKKATDKIMKMQSPKTSPDSSSNTMENNGPSPAENQDAPVNKAVQPAFPKTGKTVNAVGITYSVDLLANSSALLQKPVIIKGLKIAKSQGITGTDREILKRVLEDPQLFGQIGAQLSNDPANAAGLNEVLDILRPAQTFGPLAGDFHYYITNNYIRAELADSPNSIGKKLFDNLGGVITIVDLRAKKSYAISNYLNIVPAAVVEQLENFQYAFGLADYYKKILNQTDIHPSLIGPKLFGKYQASGVRLELPVKPGIGKDGKPDDSMLYLHCVFNGKWEDLENKNYNPKYKLYLEMYYSHELDKLIPPAITQGKGLLGINGFFVGYTLKDENGRQVSYGIKSIDPSTAVDEGLLTLPAGYPEMTHEELETRILKKLGLKH